MAAPRICRIFCSLGINGGSPMLVLSRKKDQEIVIGDDVVVKVLEIRGDRVKLGFDAPSDVKIYRKELWIELRPDGVVPLAG